MREKPGSDKESQNHKPSQEQRDEHDQQEPKGKRRLDLSVPQVAGSAVAAVVAAKLAASFGVYGTILGAGVVSAVATCGGTVFQHFFRRTGEQIRDKAVQAKPRVQQVPVTDGSGAPVAQTFRAAAYAGAASPASATSYAGAGPVTTTWGRTAEADATSVLPAVGDAGRTTVLPAVGDAERTTVLSMADTDVVAAAAADAAVEAEKTQLLGSVDATQLVPRDDATRVLRQTAPGAPSVPSALPLPSEEFTERTTHRTQVRGWKRPLIAAAVVFGVAMAGITTYEIVSGEDFSGGHGTTIGNGFTGNRTPPKEPSTPSTDPSVQPSAGASTDTDDGSRQGDDASQEPSGTNSQTPEDGSDSDSGSQTDPDKGSDSGDDDSKTDPTPTPTPTTPTPTPTPSENGGSGSDTRQGETATP